MNNPCYSIRRLMDFYREKAQVLCRVCGRVLVARGKRHNASYQCTVFSEHLNSIFAIDITNDVPDIHPPLFCYQCKRVIDKSVHAQHHLAPSKASTNVFKWEAHDKRYMLSVPCKCMYMDSLLLPLTSRCHPKRGARKKCTHPGGRSMCHAFLSCTSFGMTYLDGNGKNKLSMYIQCTCARDRYHVFFFAMGLFRFCMEKDDVEYVQICLSIAPPNCIPGAPLASTQ